MKQLITFFTILLTANFLFAAPVFDMPPQVEVKNYQPPSPMKTYDGEHLVYELIITNFGKSDQELVSIDVADAANPKNIVARFKGEALNSMLQKVGTGRSALVGMKQNKMTLEPGSSAVAFMWLDFDEESKIPEALAHTLTFKTKREGGKKKQIKAEPVPVKTVPVSGLAKPFKGDGWFAGNGPSNQSNHRRALLLEDGKPFIGQRFAIDWVRIGKNGMTYRGNPQKNSSYYAYGTDVLAVADGKVVKVQDGIPENTPADDDSRAVVMNLKTIGGNQVAIDLGLPAGRQGNGQYALYAHLIPGSILVKEGDTVKTGQPIAKLGNSGNSTEPHLHLQVSDRPDFIASEGIPYVFSEVTVRKTEGDPDPQEDAIGPIKTTGKPPVQAKDELVLDEDLVDFG